MLHLISQSLGCTAYIPSVTQALKFLHDLTQFCVVRRSFGLTTASSEWKKAILQNNEYSDQIIVCCPSHKFQNGPKAAALGGTVAQ